jgi:hypothetical protein
MAVPDLLARRKQILDELTGLTQMRRGSITEQCMERVDERGRVTRRGPYPLLTFKEKGRTVARRLHTPEDIARCRRQIENFRRFEELMAELREVGEALCETTDESVEKKRRGLPSSRTRK